MERDERIHAAIEIFADAMASEMYREGNRAKGDWTKLPVKELIADLTYHTAKLAFSVYNEQPTRVLEHAADCGNLAWMIAHREGYLNREWLDQRIQENDLGGGLVLADPPPQRTYSRAGYPIVIEEPAPKRRGLRRFLP